MPLRTTETKSEKIADASRQLVVVGSLLLAMSLLSTPTLAQSSLQGVDLTSPEMTEAEMTRAQVVEQLSTASRQNPADFTRKRLSGLDLSGIDFKADIRLPLRFDFRAAARC